MKIAIVTFDGFNEIDSIEDRSLMARIKVAPDRHLVASQCSGALVLARLGMLRDIPACTDVRTRPDLEAAGVKVIEAPFYARGNIASAGGCLFALPLLSLRRCG
jgi:transcriptional regulator GlxA family with amidase domain